MQNKHPPLHLSMQNKVGKIISNSSLELNSELYRNRTEMLGLKWNSRQYTLVHVRIPRFNERLAL